MDRLLNAAEGVIFAGFAVCLVWAFGALVKMTFKKEVRISTVYVAAIGFGFAARHVLIQMM